ncbi:MAG: hypothetical protein IJN92_03260 [Lachnospiraceae bacterium]|nr:hypothetical protein [Lachnospiraceae bacterium]
MKQTLKRLKGEQYEYIAGTVEFSVPRISLTGRINERITGEFTVCCNLKEEFRAFIYSSNYRVSLDKKEVFGEENVISYICDTSGMEEGDTLKSDIYVMSNAGQFMLPLELSVTSVILNSSMGAVKNLFHFANLAKTNWNEAVELFYSKDFKNILKGNDRQYITGYEGLSKYKNSEQNVEEFLVMIHKKKAIEYMLTESESAFEQIQGRQQEKLVLERNGWGYLRLFLKTEGAFLQLEKEELLEADFLGNRCELPYYILEERLHEGINVGKICLFNSMVSLEFHVTVKNQKNFGREVSYRRDMKKLTVQFVRAYVDFRIKKISETVFFENAKAIVDKMLKLNSRNIQARLYQAQILVIEEKVNEAKWVLRNVENMIEEHGCDDETYGYFLYVNALYEKSDKVIEKATSMIENLYEKNKNSTLLLWMLLYLKEEYENDYVQRQVQLEKAYQNGSNSPLLYVESYLALRKKAVNLIRLGDYEQQMLFFLIRNDLLTEEVINQIVYLAGKEKEYSKKLFQILKACYEKKPGKEVLGVICNLLIKGNKTGEKWFYWYDMAVKEELRITRLYEYYMLSLDKGKEELLPKTVLLYFSYECTMDYENAAYIYANVTAHKEEIPELYLSYEKQIQTFLEKQIKAGHMNKHLAFLYKKFVKESMISKELAEDFVKLLFLYEVQAKTPEMKQVVVLSGQIEGEHVYPLQEGKAHISLYTEDYMIFLEDKWGNRYSQKKLYQLNRYLRPEAFLVTLEDKVEKHLGFFLYMSHEQRSQSKIQDSHMQGYKILIEGNQIKRELKKEIFLKVIPYLYEKNATEQLDDYLETMEFDLFNQKERAEMLSYLVIREMYEKAYQVVTDFGFEGVSPKTLVQLCNYKLAVANHRNTGLLNLCNYVFKNKKYNGKILDYLMKYEQANPRYLREIWQAAVNAGVEAYDFAERILLICLFSGCFLARKEEVFAYYLLGNPDEELVEGYLSESAYEYFVKEQITEERLFENMISFYKKKGKLSKVCMLAFLKYFSKGEGTLSLEEKQMIQSFLMQMLKQDTFFPFYLEYRDIFPVINLYNNYTFIEYRGEPGSRAVIHYVIEKEGGFCSKYQNEEMQEVYGNIFLKKFVLFFGERLQYYITEIKNGKETLTESGTIEKNDTVGERAENRYKIINEMAMSQSLKEYDSMTEIAGEYAKKIWQCDRLFTAK